MVATREDGRVSYVLSWICTVKLSSLLCTAKRTWSMTSPPAFPRKPAPQHARQRRQFASSTAGGGTMGKTEASETLGGAGLGGRGTGRMGCQPFPSRYWPANSTLHSTDLSQPRICTVFARWRGGSVRNTREFGAPPKKRAPPCPRSKRGGPCGQYAHVFGSRGGTGRRGGMKHLHPESEGWLAQRASRSEAIAASV